MTNQLKGTIVFVTSFMPYRGSEVYVMQEASAMKRAGMDMLIIPRTASGPVTSEGARDLLEQTLPVPLFNVSILTNTVRTLILRPGFFFGILRWIIESSDRFGECLKGIAILPKALYLARLLRTKTITHIHAHSTTTVAVVGYVLSISLRVPWSVVLHSASTVNKQHYRLFRTLLGSVNFLRSVNMQGKTRLIELLGQRYAQKLLVIHQGVNCDVCRSNNESIHRRISIITVANYNKQKGLDVAVNSARLLLERGVSNFKWRIYGRGPLRGALMRQISAMGLANLVDVADYIANDRLMRLYCANKVDIFVLPSSIGEDGSFEGIPHSLKEAMAYKIPVISTAIGGTAELLGDGAGFLVADRDSSGLAYVLAQLIMSESLRRELGLRGRARVVDKFNLEDTIRQLEQAFLECR